MTEVAWKTMRQPGTLWKPVLECRAQVIPLKCNGALQKFKRA